MQTQRLSSGDRALARKLFALMASVFEEDQAQLSDTYADALLSRSDFWIIAAFINDELVGGLTAHTLPMTRSESAEVFIYDLAVDPRHQRKGVGRQLVEALREDAALQGIFEVLVPADNQDLHALEFYRAIGGTPTPVTFFSFPTTE